MPTRRLAATNLPCDLWELAAEIQSRTRAGRLGTSPCGDLRNLPTSVNRAMELSFGFCDSRQTCGAEGCCGAMDENPSVAKTSGAKKRTGACFIFLPPGE